MKKTYAETLEFLFNSLPVFSRVGGSAYKEGLERAWLLDKALGNPHTRYRTIHVAGTNGKGSTSHLLAAVLQCAGYRVGLYTSPHLKDFRERIRVNGQRIDEAFVVDFVEQHQTLFDEVKPSFFEMTSAMAMHYFAEKQVDIAVIEVGLGGRLDSTNIIAPMLSVITNISLDHTQFLGDTLAKIAAEKAGIIKPHVPVVVGETTPETRPVFERVAQENCAPIFFVGENGTDYPNLKLGLQGMYQQKNAATVLTAIRQLQNSGLTIPDQTIYAGFERVVELTGLQGRWQTFGTRPLIVCDTGHNEAGIRFVVEQLAQLKYNRLHIVFGMVNDKDSAKILALLPVEARYYFTNADIPRALPAAELARQAERFGLRGAAYPSVREALEAARCEAVPDDVVFIGGSTYVVAEAI